MSTTNHYGTRSATTHIAGSIPMLWDDDSPRVRVTDPLTSHEAADLNSSTVYEVRDLVIFILREYGHQTDEQIFGRAEIAAGKFHLTKRWSPSRLRTARHELEEAGRVINTGKFGRTQYGRKTTIWGLK